MIIALYLLLGGSDDGRCYLQGGIYVPHRSDLMISLCCVRPGTLNKTSVFLQGTKNYNWSCLYDEQCYVFGPDSSCQSKRCLCNEGSHLVEDLKFCWVNRGIGESCQADEDCYVADIDEELTCTDSVCSCPTGMVANSNNTACKSENAGESSDQRSSLTSNRKVVTQVIFVKLLEKPAKTAPTASRTIRSVLIPYALVPTTSTRSMMPVQQVKRN